MNTRLTIVLVTIFVVLLGAVYFTEGRKPAPPPQDGREAPTPLLDVKKDDATRLHVAYQGASATYERGGDGTWKVIEHQGQLPEPTPQPTPPAGVTPVPTSEVPNVDGQVKLVLDRLLDLQAERVVLPEPSAKDGAATPTPDPGYGFDVPTFEATLQTPKQSSSIAVGKLNPSGFSYYVRRADKKDVVLASKGSIDSLTRTATELLRASAS